MGKNPTKEILDSIFGVNLEKLDIRNYIANSITAGGILSNAVDFLKKLGALKEFTETLNLFDKKFFIALFEERPKDLGGNPFV